MKAFEKISVIKIGENYFDGKIVPNENMQPGQLAFAAGVTHDLNEAAFYFGASGDVKTAEMMDRLRTIKLKAVVYSWWAEVEFTYTDCPLPQKIAERRREESELSEAWLLISFIDGIKRVAFFETEKEKEAEERRLSLLFGDFIDRLTDEKIWIRRN